MPANVAAPAVAEALAVGAPVVALESTIVAHGLPWPDNLAVAREVEDVVCAAGAVPATIAVLDGVPVVGVDADALERLARAAAPGGEEVRKLSARDLGLAAATGTTGATTVAATAHLAARAGVRTFATGGLGGVHRGARDTWDESADLAALARARVVVVCAGVKSILDVAATLERLEALGVPVVGYGTDRFAGFYLEDSGHPVDWRLDDPAAVAAAFDAAAGLGLGDRALVVAQPLPPDEAVDRPAHDAALEAALAAAEAAAVRGKDVTPFLLDRFHADPRLGTLEANRRIIVRNAGLAAAIAVALADRG